MDISEYKNIYLNEEKHFHYISTLHINLMLIANYLKVKKNALILDAGCGTGLLAKRLQKYGIVYALDSNYEALKWAKKRGVKKTIFGSINKLPFSSNKFDLITSIDVLYHKKVDPRKAIKEFKRVLKDNGTILIKVPAYNWLKGKHDIVVHTKQRFTKKKLTTLLTKEGFEILKASYGYSYLLPIAIIKRFIEGFMMSKAHSDISSVHPIINNALIAMTKIESMLLQYISIPFGITIYVVALKPSMDKNKKNF